MKFQKVVEKAVLSLSLKKKIIIFVKCGNI
jgi:hypothetical protein